MWYIPNNGMYIQYISKMSERFANGERRVLHASICICDEVRVPRTSPSYKTGRHGNSSNSSRSPTHLRHTFPVLPAQNTTHKTRDAASRQPASERKMPYRATTVVARCRSTTTNVNGFWIASREPPPSSSSFDDDRLCCFVKTAFVQRLAHRLA